MVRERPAFTTLNVAAGHNLWESPKANLGPQIGFNWSPGSFNNKLVVRGGYGLNFNQDEIAITANLANNPPTQNFVNYSFSSPTNPGTNGGNIIYAVSSDIHSLNGFPPNPHAITSYTPNGLPTAGSASVTIVGDGYGNLPTTYVQHFSLEGDYEFSKDIVASLGYQGSVSRHLINHMGPNAAAVVAGWTLNPLVPNGGGDFWINEGMANNNAMLVEVKHPFVHHFSADVQFQWAKSMDTDGSGPYYEDPYYPQYSGYSYGPSDFNVGKQFKAFGLWQPVIFHGDSAMARKDPRRMVAQRHLPVPHWLPVFAYLWHLAVTVLHQLQLLEHPSVLPRQWRTMTTATMPSSTATTSPTTSSTQGRCRRSTARPRIVQQSTTYFTTPNFANAMQVVAATAQRSAQRRAASDSQDCFGMPLSVLTIATSIFRSPRASVFLTLGFSGESAKIEIRADMSSTSSIS